jgi:hypothetical protein
MGSIVTGHKESAMSRGTANRIRFYAGIGIAASGVAVLAGNLVGLIAA